MNEKKQQRTKNQKNSVNSGYYFLAGVIILYFVLFLVNDHKTITAFQVSTKILMQVLPVFLLVILFMGLINLLVDRKRVSKYLGESAGLKGWLLAAVSGLLSHGPIYAWYPLVRDLKNQGMSNKFIALFLYNRAIKIPMLPMMIYYFGLKYVLVFSLWMLVASIVQAQVVAAFDKYL